MKTLIAFFSRADENYSIYYNKANSNAGVSPSEEEVRY